jgi:acetoin utilization deacetylase AcuC-like enzyme
VHSSRLIDELERLSPDSGFVAIDSDTFMGVHTLEAAQRAAGAAVLATDLVLEERINNAFCAVRPPGHHAERDRAMGFCFFNNVAVGVAQALDVHGLQRVAVLDFDVHHGNGTEDIFADDQRVLFCSAFQHPFYPRKGADTQSTHIVSVPLPAGTRGEAFRASLSDRWLPAIDAFQPEMIFVSAGFDGHLEDPMSNLSLVDDDYRWVSELIVELAHRHARGRIVSCLEGGYALDALSRCVCEHIRILAEI